MSRDLVSHFVFFSYSTRPFYFYLYRQDHFISLYTRPFDRERLGVLSYQSDDHFFPYIQDHFIYLYTRPI